MTTGDIRDWFTDPALRSRLETEVLPHHFPTQRWFGGKGREIERVRVTDAILLKPWPEGIELAFVEVGFSAGPAEAYCLPLSFDGAGFELVEAGLIPHVGQALAQALSSAGQLPTRRGYLCGFRTAELPSATRFPLPVQLSADQSNSSLRFQHHWIMKLIRRLMPGVNPDIEIGQFLLQQPTFRRVPALAGWVEYQQSNAEPITLAILHEFETNNGTAWEHALRSLQSEFTVSSAGAILRHAGRYLGHVLGRATGGLHLALAAEPTHPDFRPEPLGEDDLKQVQRRIHEHLEVDLPQVERAARGDDRPWRELAKSLLDRREELIARARPPRVYPGTTRIRCHGDYHLGQVLWCQSDCWIIDFEGEPTRPLAERRAKQCPLKDVAGMLRSFDYAAHAAVRGLQNVDAETRRNAEEMAHAWRNAAQASFLEEYRNACRGAGFIPPGPYFEETLNFFLLDKALHELHYELNNRPDWVGIPLAGIIDLLS